MLGGASFHGEDGLGGHSDGDVVCHALADAVLGAAAMGDVGEHFPDSDPRFEGIGGLDLLARTVALVHEAALRARSCDLTVICERPAIQPRREEMRELLAVTLRCDVESVSVKATRPEGLGMTGDGVGCMALAVLESMSPRAS
jgi:2-C-methyl-D-erythritol 2,4-cyclodiphosphate synthase